tara:strand:+ start:1119 stop:2825 length:1707 start_codon:yes stop_codon:yes gene_type:complete
MQFLFFIFLISSISHAELTEQLMIAGKRSNQYRAWIYFKDKSDSELGNISDKAYRRRVKNNVDLKNDWYDKLISKKYLVVLESYGIKIDNESRWLNAVSVTSDLETLNNILSLKFIKKIEPVHGYKKHTQPNNKFKSDNEDTSFEIPQRNLDYGNSYAQIEQLNCHLAHEAGYFGQGVRILVLDTGYKLSHLSLQQINVVSEYDFINNDEITENEASNNDAPSQHNHGTSILSLLAGYLPGTIISPAFESEYLLAKTEDVSSETRLEEDNYVAALEWGESYGADISTSSLGYLDWYSYCDMDGNTAVTTIAVDIAARLGVLCVTSAGNWGADNPSEDPCQIPIRHYISAPADADTVIAVGAVNNSGNIAYFSSRGPTYDGRIKPEVCAMGLGVWCASANNNDNLVLQSNGTSTAAPLISGAIAVIMSAQPNWNAMEVRNALLQTSSKNNNPDNIYGYGIPDVINAINFQQLHTHKTEPIHPHEFHISKAYPNPFNPSVSIDILINRESNLLIEIFNTKGKKMFAKNYNLVAHAPKKMTWNLADYPSGIYFFKTKLNSVIKIQKVTLIK